MTQMINPPPYPRVLLVAENTSAKFGGEAALPLHMFRVLRHRGIPAWLITHARNRSELEPLFPHDTDRIMYVPDTWMHRFLYQLGRLLPNRISIFTTGLAMHLLSQFIARRMARRLVAQHNIDVVHQPIPVSPRQFSILHGMGAPVIIGPMNGGMSYPPAFRQRESRWINAAVTMGRMCSNLANRLLPGKLKASVLLVANERSRRALPKGVKGQVLELVENGVDLSLWLPSENERSLAPGSAGGRGGAMEKGKPNEFVFVGRLVGWKGVDLLLRAFQRLSGPAVLHIIGDGDQRAALEKLAEELGVKEREGGGVKFHGWMSQTACAVQLAKSDVFVLSSLYECGGAVVLEAMAVGLPVIATNWGGPADYIDASCGILVDPTDKESFIAGLAAAMQKLAADPDLRRKMATAGRSKIEREYDWERKMDRILDIYAHA